MSAAYVIPDEVLDADVATIAQKGAGKTYVTKGMVERNLRAGMKNIVVDPMGVWWGLKVSADGGPGFPVVVVGGPHQDLPLDWRAAALLARVIHESDHSFVVDVSELRRSELIAFATLFFEELYRLNAVDRKPTWLVLEESDVFAPQNPSTDGSRAMHDAVDQLARRGRHRGFRLYTITQRPARLSKDVLTQASTLLMMRIRSPQDRAAAEEWIKGHADPARAREISASLSSLKVGEGYVWSPDLDLLQRVQFPKIETLDNSSTPKAGEARVQVREMAQADLAALREALSPAEATTPAPASPEACPALSLAEREAIRSEGYAEGQRAGFAKGYDDGQRAGASFALGDLRPVIASLEGYAYGEEAGGLVQGLVDRGDGKLETVAVPFDAATRRIIEEASHPMMSIGGVIPLDEEADETEFTPMTPSPAQQRILDKIAWCEAFKVPASRIVVAALAGYTASGGGFRNYMGALRTGGLVSYPQPEMLALTSRGRAVARQPTKALTNGDVQAAILSAFDPAPRKILNTLIEAYPEAVSREELAKATGYEATGGGFRNYLGKLRTFGVATYPTEKMVKAADILFPLGPKRGR